MDTGARSSHEQVPMATSAEHLEPNLTEQPADKTEVCALDKDWVRQKNHYQYEQGGFQ